MNKKNCKGRKNFKRRRLQRPVFRSFNTDQGMASVKYSLQTGLILVATSAAGTAAAAYNLVPDATLFSNFNQLRTVFVRYRVIGATIHIVPVNPTLPGFTRCWITEAETVAVPSSPTQTLSDESKGCEYTNTSTAARVIRDRGYEFTGYRQRYAPISTDAREFANTNTSPVTPPSCGVFYIYTSNNYGTPAAVNNAYFIRIIVDVELS